VVLIGATPFFSQNMMRFSVTLMWVGYSLSPDVNAMAQARRVVVVPMKSAVYHCISCVRIGLIGSSGSEVPWYRHAAALDLRQRREKSVHCHALIA